MYAYIKGTLAAIGASHMVVEAGGIGYKLLTSYGTLRQLPAKGSEITAYTYLNVREDALELFGFFTENELDCFKMLTTVTGVGPRVALSILAEVTPEQFAIAVVTKDTKRLTMAAGVGNKLAQRIILELTDRIGKEQLAAGEPAASGRRTALAIGSEADEAVSALVVLGYSQSEALRVIRNMNTQGMPVEEIIKLALRELMK
ncbi:MAG TPA: Holliday junction branch migration protein RuvA [Candidatus Acidoferrum sp.]|nr:Holliday junction branch migration protein RuvA [Candidatus Acidoferrum sp.]